jgi:hypothetical protein
MAAYSYPLPSCRSLFCLLDDGSGYDILGPLRYTHGRGGVAEATLQYVLTVSNAALQLSVEYQNCR